ncbi:MAG: transglutaminase-like cysteine peptidase [Methylobacter sp.]|nr:transglutaminase-like cysteine peptidase [Methylobacter sp.]
MRFSVIKFILISFIGFFLLHLSNATNFSKLADLAGQRYGIVTQNTILRLQITINQLKTASELEKITRINDFFNTEIKYFDEDINIWGESDYWATPLESLGKERGDCEDFSIAKYVFLRELEIPNERLKLTYVRAQIGGPHSRVFTAHMVLIYYATPEAEPLILDNLIPSIRPASRRTDLIPVFSFNSEGLWVGASNTPMGESLNNLSRWRNVLARIYADGIDKI